MLLAMLTPIFIYRGRRTGGTAVMDAFAANDDVVSYYDVLHASLAEPYSAIADFSSNSWASGHPVNVRYFETFAPLVSNDRVEHFQKEFLAIAALDGTSDEPQLYTYLDSLVRHAHARGQRPIMGLETGEFLIPWLRNRFPDAKHLGISRSAEATLTSWLEQWALGNSTFVDDGVRRVLANPQSFSLSTEEAKAQADLDDASRIALARHYIETTDRQRREATDCFISMDDLANNSEASGLAHAQAILEFDDVSWNAITSRLLSSRPDRGLVNSYANIVASREILTQRLRASEEHADALTAAINSLTAEIERLSTEIESLSHANASLADQLTRAGEHNAELSERYREAVQYSERPRLALRVLRTKSGAALRARLHRHRPS